MSWLKIYSAVLAAILTAWVIISVVTLAIWSAYLDHQMASLKSHFEQFQDEMSSVTGGDISPQFGVVERTPTPAKEPEQPSATERSKPTTSASAVQTNKKMCEFWRAEYQKDATRQNEGFMEMACIRYRKSLRELQQ
ncbi:hypothetical protein SAMN05216429_102236 [Marinobacter persicus]|uniref:Uncharacterized protein n=1 Tax=Marinobacter persicus TaxID=930118 RepID=A0A1I3R4T2_9GAMM|nr:hypothetical protein [Marinobacter persicus]GHD43461.1 hypothetical protein GCM10008110_07430 [Marinobacter persicus]SFJ40752.1 hypothetical protein SAMN05216429_102236 [Marinobacter persicus]